MLLKCQTDMKEFPERKYLRLLLQTIRLMAFGLCSCFVPVNRQANNDDETKLHCSNGLKINAHFRSITLFICNVFIHFHIVIYLPGLSQYQRPIMGTIVPSDNYCPWEINGRKEQGKYDLWLRYHELQSSRRELYEMHNAKGSYLSRWH